MKLLLPKNVLKFLFVAMLFVGQVSFGQISITTTTAVTQNFNSITSGSTLPTNWKIQNSSSPTWAGASSTTTVSYVSSGAPSAGGTYIWGNTANTDTSVGAMTSSGFSSPNNLLSYYVNSNAAPITSLAVSYNAKKYRTNSAAASVQFFYSLNGTTWTAVTAGDIAAATIGTGSSSYIFGSPTTYPVSSFNITGLNITNSSNFYLRWNVITTGSNSQAIGIDDVSVAATFGAAPISSNLVTGNWSSTSSWAGGVVPTSADKAIIISGSTITMDNTTYNTRNADTTVDVGGTLATSVQYINNSITTINGTFQLNAGGYTNSGNNFVYGAAGTLNFNNTSSYGVNNGDQYWPTTSGPFNVTILQGGMALNSGANRTVAGTFQTAAAITLNATLTLNGTAQINAGGYFANAPTYGNASTLVYNTGNAFGRGSEWTTATSGAGYPANVQISNPGTNTTLNMGSNSAQCSGNLTVDASATINTTSAGLTVLGNVVSNGTISLGGDVTTPGNWTIGSAGTQTNNSKAVFFNAALGNQTITKTGAGTVAFDYLIVNKAAGNVMLSSSPATSISVNATAGGVLQLNNAGSLDLNGQTLTLNNAGGNIDVNGARTIISTLAGGKLAIAGNKTVTGVGSLATAANVTIIATAGLDFGSGKTTVNGTFQINGGGYANTNAPIYGNASNLIYNGVTSYGVGAEWTGNATTAGNGTPQNVTLTTSSVNMPNTIRSLAGNLSIGIGSTLALNGTLGADLNISGNWSNSGTFTPTTRLVQFRGTAAQSITGATTFDYLTINNSSTGVTLANNVTVNSTLGLTAGKLTLGANNLTVGGAITGGGATNYVVTSSTGQLKRTVGAGDALFPVGNSAYDPITFNNTGGTSDVYGVRMIDGAITTGLNNTKTVSRRWVTTEAVAGGSNLAVVAQYNSGEVNTGYNAATTPYIGFYNGSAWSQVGAVLAGVTPVTATSSANSTPADLTTGIQYFAVGKDNAFLSVASLLEITAISPATPGAGYGFSVTVRSKDAYGTFSNVIADTAFTLTTNGNAGAIGGTVTGTILAGTNTVTVTGVTLASAGILVTLTATKTSGDALTAGTSSTFTVLAAADHLAFVGLSSTGNVGVDLASFTVEARRPDNSVDALYTGNVTIVKATGTGNLTGTLTVAAVAGVATFNAAQFDAASTYTITASSGSFTPITSGNIVVTVAPVVIAQFDFSTYTLATAVVVTSKNTNVSVTDMAISAGTITAGVTSGSEFPNEPYISSTGGWTTTTQTGAKNFNFTVAANTGYKIEITSFQFNAVSTAAGPSALSYNIASGASLFTMNATDTALMSVNQTGLGLTNLTSIPVLIQGWLNGSRSTAGSGNLRLDDVILKGYVTCIEPTAYAVTGSGGSYCAGGSGFPVGIANSQLAMNYQLNRDGSSVGAPVAGTGAAIAFGNQTVAGVYTVVATNTNGTCNLATDMTGSVAITAGSTTTWSGSWDNGAPTSTSTAIIAANYSLATNIEACTLTVNNSAVVTIPSGFNVTLNGALTVATGSSFTLSNNANLIQVNDVANSGAITVNRNSASIMRLDYTLWSSPVTGQGLYAFSPFTFANRFYIYNPNKDEYSNDVGFNIQGLDGNNVNGTDANNVKFSPGKGYLIRAPWNFPTAPTNYSGTFTGIPNNGNGFVTTTIGNYYAVGNPYPTTIDANEFISQNSIGNDPDKPGDGLYFWRKTNNSANPSYATYTTAGGVANSLGGSSIQPNGTIQVGQGFIVKATSSSLNFNNTMKTNNHQNQFLKNAPIERNRVWLNMTGENGVFGQMMIAYMTNATQGIDAGIDGRFFNDSPTALNSLVNNEAFAIQGRSLPFEASDVVPMVFKAANAGKYTIAIDHVDGLFESGNVEVYLKDNLTTSLHNLNSGAYTFSSEVGNFNNRFEIVYQNSLAVSNPTFNENQVVVYKKNQVLTINSGKVIMDNVKIYDMQGRLLYNKKNIKASEIKINTVTSNQILLVKITSENNEVITKKVMN